MNTTNAMEIIIVTGKSGAGKSVTVHTLEDMGYYCIDNLPLGLIPQTIEPVSYTHLLKQIRRQKENRVTIEKKEDGFVVTLTIPDIGSDLLSVSIFMPTRKECEAIQNRFLNDPMLVYKGVFALLTGDLNTVGDLVTEDN